MAICKHTERLRCHMSTVLETYVVGNTFNLEEDSSMNERRVIMQAKQV